MAERRDFRQLFSEHIQIRLSRKWVILAAIVGVLLAVYGWRSEVSRLRAEIKRLDTSIGEMGQELRADLDRGLRQLDASDAGITRELRADLEDRLTGITESYDELARRLARIDDRLAGVSELRIVTRELAADISELRGHIGAADNRFTAVEERLDELAASMGDLLVSVVYSREYDFSGLATYDLAAPGEATDPAWAVAAIHLAMDLSVEGEMSGKGYQRTASDPDVVIQPIAGPKAQIANLRSSWLAADSDVYASLGPWHLSETGNLVIEVIDPDSNRVIWGAAYTNAIRDGLTSEQLNARLQAAAADMLRKFPPR